MPAGWTFKNLSADGAELAPSNSGGSAVFKQAGSELAIQLGMATNAATRISFSVRAATTKAEGAYQTTLIVESSANGIDFDEVGSIVNQTKLSSSRQTYLLPKGSQAVRLRMTNRVDANLLVDAVKVSTAPEVVSFTPAEGGFDTEVIITGGNFLGATAVTFGDVEAEYTVNSETQITARVPAGAPVGKIAVTSAEGTGVSITDFIVSAPVVTTGFNPKEGGAGTLVTINGQYFKGATNVYFNGVAGTDLDVIDDSNLTVKVPGGASTGRIVVATPAGRDTSFTDFKIYAPKFTVPAPFSPAKGGAGTEVTITGEYFSGVTAVSFNGVTASFTEISDTEIQAVVPVNAGDGVVKVTTPAGSATSTDPFDFIPAPVIAGFEPAAGVEGATEVTVKGQYLEDIVEVLFADGVAANIADLVLATDQATGEQSFTVTVPEGAVTGKISLKNPGGTATSASVFTVYKAPVIEAFAATTGRPGDVVTITGTGLTGVETVTFLGTAEAEDEVAAATFTVVSDTEIKVTVPIGAISGQIALKNPVAEVTTAALEVSEFTVDATPRIISFSPTTAYQGTELTITGQNLSDVTAVTFFGGASVDVTEAEVTTDEKAIQSFIVVVPAGAQTGPVSVTTLLEATATSDSDLTIISKPFVDSFTPEEGRAGDTFTVTGTGFSGDLTVTVGGGAVTYNFVSDTEITVTLTSDAVTGKVVVSNIAGSGTSTEDFTVLTTPLISKFTPVEGPIGTEVKITGKLLSQVTEVTFGESAAAAPISITATEVVVQVPADATTGFIAVNGENGAATSASEFRVIPSPQISSFTPEAGPVGTEVTIIGTNFTDVDSVKFNGIAAASFTVAADGQSITATVPEDAAKGKITVVNPAGKATSSEDFEVPAPAITSLSKTEGFVGEPVVISGQYFTGASAVTFNGVEAASYKVDSDEQITAYPPADAGEGVIAVTTASGTGDSGTMLFKVLSPEITDIYVGGPSNTINEGYFGTEVTIVGNYLNGATDVTFNGVSATFQSLTDELGNTYLLANVPQARLYQNVGPISVTTPSGTGESSESFKTLAPEQITFNPVSGRVGESVTVSGVYFRDVTSISFGGVPVSIPADGQTEPVGTEVKSFTVKIPSGASSGMITVTSTSGIGASAESFTVLSPDILTINPTSGRVGMTTVEISGKYFLQATEVRFMGGSGTSDDVVLSPGDFIIVDDNNIKVVVPAGAKTGPISVTTPSGTDASGTFKLLAPTFTSFTPTQGQVNRTTFTITGNYFLEASKVTFLSGTSTDVDATSFKVDNDNQITVTVPLGAKTGRIAVTTPSGTSTSSFNFTVLAPVVTSITPAEGNKAGEAITITGKYFDDLQTVQFNGLAATSFTGPLNEAGKDADGVELKSLTIAVPEGAVTGPITLTTLSGTGSSASYKIIPEIDDFFPKIGPFATEVTITGMSLTNSSVTFTGKDGARIAATNVSNSNTEVVVTVPNGARTGLIELTTAGGTVATTEAFVVTSPIIDKLTPTEGKVGSKLTITGVNLRDVGKVVFSGGVATSQILESEDGTSLEVIVPKGAQTGKVSVFALVGPTAVSEEVFTVIVPVITLSGSLAEFRAMVGEESAPQQYTVSGTNLEANINLAAPRANFVIASSMEGPYTKTLSIPMNEDSAVVNYPVWVKYIPTTEDTHQATISHTSVNAASKSLTVRGSSIVPLPVELMAFNAALQNNSVLLTWATASEQNNSHFEVEMSRDAKKGFEKIGRVDSKGSNSSIRLNYEFTHRLGNLSGTIYYRLKQVDLDGTTDYSKVVAVNVKTRELVQQLLVAPNPINYNSKLFVTAEVSGKANVVLYNMTGKKVYSKVIELQEGPNEVQLPVYEKLTKGMYVLKVELNGQVSQIKVMKE
ncbi:IPT/TIG domain-containing protein [Pontibacter litorisediminis]|uniref:IPT/TIG domain-containing protein n=1 Tax=Pontibacter litorisediminis TaxID=1846260 RepID=UPI0023EDAB89|nr:IPT/TIG domain-containing protein [Pontibacter litorisediminis]